MSDASMHSESLNIPKLMRHEMRLWSRGLSRSKQSATSKSWPVALVVVLVLIVLHLIALPFALGFSNEAIVLDSKTLTSLTAVACLLFAWMVSQALNSVTQALYSRGDVELLLTAPVSMRHVLTVRALAISVPVIFSWGFIILPLANWMAFFDSTHWLLTYPVMAALGLLATATGLVLTMALFALIGPRRTRVLGQILSVLIGASAFIALQARAVLPDAWVDAVSTSLARLSASGTFAFTELPARAIFGSLNASLVLIVFGIVSFVASVWLFGGTYAAKAAAIAGATEKAMPQTRMQRQARSFRSGANISLMLKEWRLLRRDPWLISQVLLQLIYIIPMGFAFWKSSELPGAPSTGLAPMLAMLAGQLAGGLVWITISGEDAPDLVASAPVATSQILRAKILAATIPVAIIMLLPLVFLARQSLYLGVLTAAACTVAALSATLACLWTQKPRPRKTFGYRQKGSVLANLAETALNFCWFFALAAVLWKSVWALAPLGIAAVLMLVLYRLHKRRAA